MAFCRKCGQEVNDEAVICVHCGCVIENSSSTIKATNSGYSEKDWVTTLLLCILLGFLGIHRFYVGKSGTGVLWLLTAGCFGIGYLVDIIQIACGNFTDISGKTIKNNK